MRLVAEVPLDVELRLACPIAMEGDIPLLNGGWNSRTRLFPASVTHRFPLESKATSAGRFMPVGVPAEALDVKFACPRTSDAASPAVKGAPNSRTRLLLVSATQRFPEGSTAIPEGLSMPFAVTVGRAPFKAGWPSTVWKLRFDPGEGFGSSRTLLFPESAIHIAPVDPKTKLLGIFNALVG